MGFQKVKLGKYITQVRGVSYGKSDVFKVPHEDYIAVLRSNNIKESKIHLEDLVYVNPLKIKPVQFLKKGDILITASTGSLQVIGKNAFCDKDYNASFGAFCKVVRPKGINENYLKYIFQSRQYFNHIRNIVNGANINNIKNEHIDDFKIPLPPLETQKRIAEILDNAAALREKTEQLLTEYDALAQSIFLDMFGDPVINPKGWGTKPITKLVQENKDSIKRGPFGGALKKEIFVDDGYLVYEQYHALNNDFTFERYFINEDDYERLKGFKVKPGDIIISCSGVYLGKLAIIPENAKEGIINQALLKLTLDESKVNKKFFVFHFMQKNFKESYFSSTRGAGIPNFPPMKEFKKFPFINPPIELQNEFAEKIELIEKQKELAKQELKESEDLFNALLQKAFKGELVS